MEFHIQNSCLIVYFVVILCVFDFSPFLSFHLREGLESSITAPNHCAMLKAGIFVDNDAFGSHKFAEPDGQSNIQCAGKPQSHKGMNIHREMAGEARKLK